MMQLFKKLNEEYGKTIIMVTHDMEHVLNYCADVVIMKEGQVERECSVNEFFKDLKFLEAMHITPPNIIQTRMLLKEKGITIRGNILTMEDLVKKIVKEVNQNG